VTYSPKFRRSEVYRAAGRELFAGLNEDKIVTEVRATEHGNLLSDLDWSMVANMIERVCEDYLARDVEWLAVTGLESWIEDPDKPHATEGAGDIAGRLDVIGQLLPAVKDIGGRRFVRDWKATRQKLDDNWRDRLLWSWQWKLYLYWTGADVFVYTGVNYDGDTRELWLLRPENLNLSVETQLNGMRRFRETYQDRTVYPMNSPSACKSYGKECPFREDCTKFTMPQQVLETWRLSHTSMDQALQCPERFRRQRLLDKSGKPEVTRALEIGQAVHRGMAEIYRQVFMEKE
jgi:hypothetical protein